MFYQWLRMDWLILLLSVNFLAETFLSDASFDKVYTIECRNQLYFYLFVCVWTVRYVMLLTWPEFIRLKHSFVDWVFPNPSTIKTNSQANILQGNGLITLKNLLN